MKISFVEPYKSITFFPQVELPDFVVLTGVNGAGKTHFLEAILGGSLRIDDIYQDSQTQPIRFFNGANLVPQDSGSVSSYQITQEKSILWNDLYTHIKPLRAHLINYLKQRSLHYDDLSFHDIVSLTSQKLIEQGCTQEDADRIIVDVKDLMAAADQKISNSFLQQNNPHRQRLLSLIKENIGLPLVAFSEGDFYKKFPKSWQSVDMFQQSLGRLFAAYKKTWIDNEFNAFLEYKGKSVEFLSKEDFYAQYGLPPWDFLNSVLKSSQLDFFIESPDLYDELPIEPKLRNSLNGIQIKFSDLSSGERVLMSFALCLYYAKDRRQLVDYPKVLLFDEIDAPLHPPMIQSVLRTIKDVLVTQHKIKVIMTTHSPSTVALAPEESLYAMVKEKTNSFQKTTKDKALAILTKGVPTLSIDYENRRQIFVESDYDASLYEKIYEMLKHYLIPDISFNFISSGVNGDGGCDRVKEVVNVLQRYGNKTVYGIIDWTLRNNGNKRVKVLGKGSRYSIENFILDPLLLGSFLFRERFITRSDICIDQEITHIDFPKLENSQLQTIADFVVNNVKSKISSEYNESKIDSKYIGGQIITVPAWFFHMQGHALEKAFFNAFPKLGNFKNENELKQAICLKVMDDIPDFIPCEFLELFTSIQNYDY